MPFRSGWKRSDDSDPVPKGPEKGAAEFLICWGSYAEGPWQEAIKNHDAIINLAGASIFSKWTDEHKKAIRESRVSTTRISSREYLPSWKENYSAQHSAWVIMASMETKSFSRNPRREMIFWPDCRRMEGEALKALEKGSSDHCPIRHRHGRKRRSSQPDDSSF